VEAQARLYQVLDLYPEFPLPAYHAIHKGLDYTVRLKGEFGHVSGQELAMGMAGYLKTEYGPFAPLVLAGWNIRTTFDFGRLVFNLIEAGLMRKQDTDSIEDFLDVYDLGEVFRPEYDWLTDIRSELGLRARESGSFN
jgi:uncharacterized repeat protein (TIGR04138 family)